MLTIETKNLLGQLRAGRLDPGQAIFLEQLGARELVADLRAAYPIMLMEHSLSQKSEVGFARSVGWELGMRKTSESLFPSPYLFWVARKCVFISSYDNAISGITMAGSIWLRTGGGSGNACILRMRHCFKLDKTPDGWSMKAVKQRPTVLSNNLLKTRGWKFDLFFPVPPIP